MVYMVTGAGTKAVEAHQTICVHIELIKDRIASVFFHVISESQSPNQLADTLPCALMVNTSLFIHMGRCVSIKRRTQLLKLQTVKQAWAGTD